MLKKQRLFLWLIPMFFILHGSSEYYGYVSPVDIAWLCIYYLGFVTLLALVFHLIFKNFDKAAIFTSLCTVLYLFFGVIQDGLKSVAPLKLFARYQILLPFFILLLSFTYYGLKKTNLVAPKTRQFLNLLFLFLLLSDVVGIALKWKKSAHTNIESSIARNDTTTQNISLPDIYLLLFDEFASPSSIFEQSGIRNDLDSFLKSKQFKVVSNSRSNYNFTPFSMASTLNMEYLHHIKNPMAVDLEDYNVCTKLIAENKVVQKLENNGYEIRNFSIFNLKGYPSRIEQSFLPLNTTLLTANTLGARIKKDLGWMAFSSPYLQWLYKNDFNKENLNNQKLFEEVTQASQKLNEKPFFIYAHFMMPHTPYYFDDKGNYKNLQTTYKESIAHNPKSYAKYSVYASTKIETMIAAIQKNNPSACILLLGDHGFRNASGKHPIHQFRNLNAVYFPDRDYASINDSLSNVNEFRLIFNKIFGEHQAFLPNKTIFLTDKK